MISIVARSFLQTFSVTGLDSISRALGWTILLLLGGALLLSAISAYSLSTFAEELAGQLFFNLFTIASLLISLIFSSYIVAPVSLLYGLLFQNRVAQSVEMRSYPSDGPGRRVFGTGPFLRAVGALAVLLLFSLMSIGLSVFGTPILGIGFYIFAGGAFLGRDQFVAVACRYLPVSQARELRRQNGWVVHLGGMAIIGIMLVPIANLMMPVFSTILMIHLYKRLASGTAI